MATEEEYMNIAFKAACMYLLYERAQSTQVKTAFSVLVQERHHEFHDEGSHFTGCKNEVCIAAKAILLEEASMKVEINPVTTGILERYNIKVNRTPNNVTVMLEEKGLIEKPQEGVMLKL